MTEIRRFEIDYLDDLFKKLADGQLDPARVDWPFAAEAWRVVCGEIERLKDRPWVPVEEHADLSERCRLMKKERDQARAERDELRREIERLRGEIERPQPVPQWLLSSHGVRLRPCPFCEADAVQLVSFGASSAELDMRYFVRCEQCGGRGPVTLYSQEAVAGWNYAREARDAALEAVRAWELASELEMKPGSGESE